jgi:hypothetical protein
VSTEIHGTLRRLHRFHEGVLGMGELVERTLFVIDAVTGRPVLPAPAGIFEQDSITLHAPEDEPGALMVLGQAVEIDPAKDAAPDRWFVYHNKPRKARWAAIEIESIKNAEIVLDREDAQVHNPLLAAEPSLIRWVNQSHASQLRDACGRSVRTTPESALLVGVDPYGLDVRAHFGVMRVEFDRVAASEPQARRAIEELLQL